MSLSLSRPWSLQELTWTWSGTIMYHNAHMWDKWDIQRCIWCYSSNQETSWVHIMCYMHYVSKVHTTLFITYYETAWVHITFSLFVTNESNETFNSNIALDIKTRVQITSLTVTFGVASSLYVILTYETIEILCYSNT